jgi:hypothetical protein
LVLLYLFSGIFTIEGRKILCGLFICIL